MYAAHLGESFLGLSVASVCLTLLPEFPIKYLKEQTHHQLTLFLRVLRTPRALEGERVRRERSSEEGGDRAAGSR